MNIQNNKDSMCLIKDVNDHKVSYQVDDSSTYEDLFDILIKDNYLPKISGNNAVWVLRSSEYNCIFSYFTKTSKMSPGLSEKSLSKLFSDRIDSIVRLELKYYATPLKWKEHIYEMYEGNEYEMWRDGWIEEIQYCDYVMSLE